MAALKWVNESAANPGYSVYAATPDRDPNVLYVIRQKRATEDFKPVGWRTFVRNSPDQPLQTIFHGDKLAECKKFVQELEELNGKAS